MSTIHSSFTFLACSGHRSLWKGWAWTSHSFHLNSWIPSPHISHPLKLEKAFVFHPSTLARVGRSIRLLNTSWSRAQTAIKPSILRLSWGISQLHWLGQPFYPQQVILSNIFPPANKSLGFISSIVKWQLHKRAKALEKPESAWSTNSSPILQLECFYVNQG